MPATPPVLPVVVAMVVHPAQAVANEEASPQAHAKAQRAAAPSSHPPAPKGWKAGTRQTVWKKASDMVQRRTLRGFKRVNLE